jgi:two-component system NtrC family response regulator
LVSHFLRQFSLDSPVTLDNKVLEALTHYNWPGNVRELENIIKRLTILAKDGHVKLTDLPSEISIISDTPDGKPIHSALIEAEIKLITDALKGAGWNQSRAATHLGIPRHVIIYRIKKYGIREP